MPLRKSAVHLKTFVFFVTLSVDVHNQRACPICWEITGLRYNQRACPISHQLLPRGVQTTGRGVGSTFLSPVQTDAAQS